MRVRHYQKILLCGLALGAFTTTSAMAQDTETVDASGADSAAANASSGGSQLDDIIVTAQRTNENLQKTPVAVTAFSSDAIARLNIHEVRDIGQVAPNVVFYQATGASAGVVPYIRGGGTTTSGLVTSESEVGVYVDDVYQPRLTSLFIDMLDIDRIEVLRGPQGTLYGRNTSAGALKIISRQPGDEIYVRGEAGIGSWNEIYGKLSASGPVSSDGKLRAGFSAMISDRDGGRQYNATLDRDVGARQFQGFRGQIAYAGDRVDISASGFYANFKSDGVWATSISPTAALTPEDYKDFPPTSGSYRTVLAPIDQFSNLRQWGGSLSLTYHVSDTIDIQSITAYQHLTDNWHSDNSGGLPNALLGSTVPGYFAGFDRTSLSSDESFSQELQVRGSALDDSLDFVAGVYYFHELGKSNVSSVILNGPSFLGLANKTKSYAAFGQLTYHFTDSLGLTVGARYTKDKKALDAVLGVTPVVSNDRFNNFSPKIALDWQATRDILFYASYSKGYRAGGYNGLAATVIALQTPYDNQTVEAYEIGVKSELFDRRVRFNLAGFINDYSKLQQQSVTSTGSFITENYDARHKGIEAELTVRAGPHLTLWGNGVYNDGHYAAGQGPFSGNRMTNVFKWQGTAGADVNFDLSDDVRLVFGGNYNYRTDYYASPDQSPLGHAPQVGLLDAYVGLDYGSWQLRLQGKNLTNEIYWGTGLGFGPIRQRLISDPRTWRLSLVYKM